MRAVAEFAAGEVVGERYRVRHLLGQGATNLVYLADRLTDGLPVALKVAQAGPSYLSGVERLWREAAFLAHVASPNLVRLHECLEVRGAPCLVMEHLEGADLSSLVERAALLPVGEAVGLVASACSGVADMHRHGVLHRDIKPSNLFRLERRAPGQVKVLDLGLAAPARASAADDPGVTRSDAVVGTPRYLAPEVVRDPTAASPASDVWALGVVLYELLSGRAPFEASTAAGVLARVVADPPVPLSARRVEVPGDLAALVERTLEKDPAARPRDAAELERLLLAWLDTAADLGAGVSVTRRSLTAVVAPLPAVAAPHRARGPARRVAALAVGLLVLGWFGAEQGALARLVGAATPPGLAASPVTAAMTASPPRLPAQPPTTTSTATSPLPASLPAAKPPGPGAGVAPPPRVGASRRAPRPSSPPALRPAEAAPAPPPTTTGGAGPAPVDRTVETRK